MMIEGVALRMGGREWIVPPLTLGQMRRLLPRIARLKDFGAEMGEAEIDVIIDLVAAALSRNYPGLTPDKVAELVDLGNAREVMQAILTGSGLTPAGEREPVADPPPSNGGWPGSMASSPPAADTQSPSSMR
jgi:hypothetical protein